MLMLMLLARLAAAAVVTATSLAGADLTGATFADTICPDGIRRTTPCR
ncbi:MAG: hypothetical protein ACI8S6_003290 [Myxococcota bacterium]|jgi:hypothetical protein